AQGRRRHHRRCRPRSPPGAAHRGWPRPYRAHPRRPTHASLDVRERAHIVGVSKTACVLATPLSLHWRHDSTPTISTNNEPADSLAPCRRPDSRPSSDPRSPRLPVAEFLVFLGRIILVFL